MADTILALDVGTKRIGVAVARTDVRLPRPLRTLPNDDSFWDQLQSLVAEHDAGVIVVGLPRGLNGQETQQTGLVREFVAELQRHVSQHITLQDEAATSVKAEAELRARGKPYEKGAIDALAATYILEDYLERIV